MQPFPTLSEARTSVSRLLALLFALCLVLSPAALAAPALQDDAPDEDATETATEPSADEAGEEAETEEDDQWDVTAPRDPENWRTIQVDTEETTWSNVDVSPDGQTIVFDALGDIFTAPIGGGDATPVATGIDWSWQPRFSPDGEHIAFISDRDGADNLWIMDADGENARKISEEKSNLVHNPNWSPDGHYLVAKKGFVSTRSIPAGEIWLFHVGGGGGLQLVERPNGQRDQKNIAEPAFSPDGRYVYYSQDTTPGVRWQYNKDSTGQIFVIRRLDRETGETVTLVDGAGGAIRPTPSPDGESLAFVKRTPAMTSAIYVKDLETGRELPIYTELDRDLQETNGSHGNTPAIAWTPDSSSIVFWAGGTLHRVDVASKEVTPIPVRVQVEHQVRQALRFPVEVAPERFPVKMIRWAQRTPDGSKIVFQALGHVWVADADGRNHRRLTSQNEHFESYPTVSRDGKKVAWVTWDDQDLGTVRVASIGGGEGRVITTEPGVYLEPQFSPDGEHVTFRRAGGGFLLSGLWSLEPGIYVARTTGGEMRRVIDHGFTPHFGAAKDRLYFVTGEGPEGESALRSVNLDGLDERQHLAGSKVTEYRVSPDGQWIAFLEGYDVHVAPFVATGKAVDLSAGSSAMPTKKVSKRAGEFLTWSGDSQSLTWGHGPVLYERALRDAFAFLGDSPEELPEPVEEGIDLSFEHPFAHAQGTLALVGGRIVTMRDADETEEVIENGVIVVEGDRIAAVGPRDEIEIPSDAEVVDITGKTVIPGLVDVHAHGAQAIQELVPQQNRQQYSNLSFGVTTIHDPSNDTSEIFAASEMQRAGQIVSPRIYSTGTILYGARGPGYAASIHSYDDALFHVRRLADAGAISVKSYNQARRDSRQQVIAAGQELGIMVVPEGGAKFQHNMTHVVDGHTGLEHAIPIARGYDDVVQLWSQTEVGYSPTFGVAYGGLSGETYWYDRTNVWENERLMAFTPRWAVEPQSIRRMTAPDEHYNHFEVAKFAKELLDAGVPVLIGAHGQREGLAAHWEMWMMEQGGFTPWEALRGATAHGAAYVGLDGDIGSIEKGKLADLVVIDGDVLSDIRQSQNVTHTVLGGRLYDSATMNQLYPEKVEREPFFFELPGGDTVHPAALEYIEEKAERFHWVHH